MNRLITFQSTHHAMAAERCLEDCLTCRLIPLPAELSAGCGLALMLDEEEMAKCLDQLETSHLPYENRYIITIENGKKQYEVMP